MRDRLIDIGGGHVGSWACYVSDGLRALGEDLAHCLSGAFGRSVVVVRVPL